MRNIRILTWFTSCALLLLSNPVRSEERKAPAGEYTQAYDELRHLGPDPSKGAAVSHLVIRRDAATFTLEDGTLFLCGTVLGRSCTALFLGHGTFSYSPPGEIEKNQLARYYDKKALDEPIEGMFIIFADSTLDELNRKLAFSPHEVPHGSESAITACMRFLSDDDGKYIDPRIMEVLLQHTNNGLFYAEFYDNIKSPSFYMINPGDEEEVTFGRWSMARSWAHNIEIINQFPSQAAQGAVAAGNKKYLEMKNYTMDCTIADNLDFSARADVGFTALTDDRRWFWLQLYPGLRVDSARWADGTRCEFFSGQNNPYSWFQCDPPLRAAQQCSLRVWYHGDLLKKMEGLGWIGIQSPELWYPRHDWKDFTGFDLTFHVPSRYRFVCIGDSISSSDSGDVATSRWKSSLPARNASFNIGFFKPVSIRNSKIPAVDVFMNETGHHEIGSALRQQMVFSGNLEEQVAQDIEKSLLFYQAEFGKCLYNHLVGTEIPYPHGEAFPGLLHFYWETFQLGDEVRHGEAEGFNEIFRAHEVAHQWWGIGVDFKTYHDQWLSEAFAEYSALWYYQAESKDNEKFFNVLKEWKHRIISNRKFIFGSGQEAGPISLGYRTESSSTQGDYSLIIYLKGAWVLHMLRNMMLDMQTMDESKFKSVMQEFYESYAGRYATTDDFRRIVEKHTGYAMDWFFSQWIDGTAVPSYKFSYRVSPSGGGKFNVRCRVRQLEVPDDFQMMVPMLVDFGGGKFVRLQAVVKGPVTEFDLPVLPMKPEKIVWNDLESVLCEVDYEDWKQ
jgi:hypothetical protein